MSKNNGNIHPISPDQTDEYDLPVLPRGQDYERMPSLLPQMIDKFSDAVIEVAKETRRLTIEQRSTRTDASRTFDLASKSAALVEAMAVRVERLDRERERPINAVAALRNDFELFTKHVQHSEERAAERRENIATELHTKYDKADGRQDAIERNIATITATLVERKDSALAAVELELFRAKARAAELEKTTASTEKVETKKLNYSLVGVIVGGIVTVAAALVGSYEIVHHEAVKAETHQEGGAK